MSRMRTKYIVASIVCFVMLGGIVNGQNLLTSGDGEGKDPIKDWGKNVYIEKDIKRNGEASIGITYDMCASPEFIPINPKKTYRLSGYFRSKDSSHPASVLLHFRFYNKDKKEITPWSIKPHAAITTLLVNAQKDTDIVRVKKSNWDTGKKRRVNLFAIAFNAKDNESDIPNLSSIRFKEIKEYTDEYVITLEEKLKKSYPAGTKVRQHVYVDYPWAYSKKKEPLTAEWKKFSITTGPRPIPGEFKQNYIWKDAAYGRVMLITRNWDGDSKKTLLFDDLFLEELDADTED